MAAQMPPLKPPTTWTSAALKELKAKLQTEEDSVVTVYRGDIMTVHVPTVPEAKKVCWEFATDGYDIGFGIYFDWSPVTSRSITVHISESSDDEEEEEELEGQLVKKLKLIVFLTFFSLVLAIKNISIDKTHLNCSFYVLPSSWDRRRCVDFVVYVLSVAGPVSNGDIEKGSKSQTNSNLAEILPVYRQDSHLSVNGGSHDFPGEGTYLLKFDNSYSLWRNKTLYYRVYYSA